jgi:hypothetical protein
MSDEVRILVGDDDICRIVPKEVFDRLSAPINEKAEQQAPPNPISYLKALEIALTHARAAESILSRLVHAGSQTRR